MEVSGSRGEIEMKEAAYCCIRLEGQKRNAVTPQSSRAALDGDRASVKQRSMVPTDCGPARAEEETACASVCCACSLTLGHYFQNYEGTDRGCQVCLPTPSWNAIFEPNQLSCCKGKASKLVLSFKNEALLKKFPSARGRRPSLGVVGFCTNSPVPCDAAHCRCGRAASVLQDDCGPPFSGCRA